MRGLLVVIVVVFVQLVLTTTLLCLSFTTQYTVAIELSSETIIIERNNDNNKYKQQQQQQQQQRTLVTDSLLVLDNDTTTTTTTTKLILSQNHYVVDEPIECVTVVVPTTKTGTSSVSSIQKGIYKIIVSTDIQYHHDEENNNGIYYTIPTTVTDYMYYYMNENFNPKKNNTKIYIKFKWDLLLGDISSSLIDTQLNNNNKWNENIIYHVVLVENTALVVGSSSLSSSVSSSAVVQEEDTSKQHYQTVLALSKGFTIGMNTIETKITNTKEFYYPGEILKIKFILKQNNNNNNNSTFLFDMNNYLAIQSLSNDTSTTTTDNNNNIVSRINMYDVDSDIFNSITNNKIPIKFLINWKQQQQQLPGLYQIILVSLYNNTIRSISKPFTVKKLLKTIPIVKIKIYKKSYYVNEGIQVSITSNYPTIIPSSNSDITIELRRSKYQQYNPFVLNNTEASCCYNGYADHYIDQVEYKWKTTTSTGSTNNYTVFFNTMQPGQYFIVVYVHGTSTYYSKNNMYIGSLSKSFTIKESIQVQLSKTIYTVGDVITIQLSSPKILFDTEMYIPSNTRSPSCIVCTHYTIKIIPTNYTFINDTSNGNCGPDCYNDPGISTIQWIQQSYYPTKTTGTYQFGLFANGKYEWNQRLVSIITNSTFDVV